MKPIGAYVGRCSLCGRENAVISFHYETMDGESGDMCTFCGQELLKAVKAPDQPGFEPGGGRGRVEGGEAR